jgi:hypothetical protein
MRSSKRKDQSLLHRVKDSAQTHNTYTCSAFFSYGTLQIPSAPHLFEAAPLPYFRELHMHKLHQHYYLASILTVISLISKFQFFVISYDNSNNYNL